MGVKRAVPVPAMLPLDVNAPPGVLGVLDDLSSMILGQLATRRKLQAILETLSEHIEVDCARFVLGCRLGMDGLTLAASDCQDDQLADVLRDYPGILDSLSSGHGTVVENGTLGRSPRQTVSGASLCVPVCRSGGIVGLLCVSTSRGDGQFSSWEVDFCSILANMAGAAMKTST